MTIPIRLHTGDHSRDAAGLTYVYPVLSRRAEGVSIGINLNPNNACNWRCIYCQVPDLTRGAAPPVDVDRLASELRSFVGKCLHGDFLQAGADPTERGIVDIAISGNGEPTSAEEFPDVVEVIAGVIQEFGLTHGVVPRLITNGSLIERDHVQRGLRALCACGGEVWFKVDAGTAQGFQRVNSVSMTPVQVIRRLHLCAELCPTWVQTCFFALDGRLPEDAEIQAYIDLLEQANRGSLRGVLLYGLARPSLQPEAARLARSALAELEPIAVRIQTQTGLTVRVSP